MWRDPQKCSPLPPRRSFLTLPPLISPPTHPCVTTDPNECLRRVLAKALEVDGVRRGLHEALKALAKGSRDAQGNVPIGGARLAILAKSATEKEEGKQIQKLVKALAIEKNCILVEIDQAEKLGEWCVAFLSLFSFSPLLPLCISHPSPFHVCAHPSSPPSPLSHTFKLFRCGLCKIDKDGKPRKVVPTSCAVITDYGEETRELKILLDSFGK